MLNLFSQKWKKKSTLWYLLKANKLKWIAKNNIRIMFIYLWNKCFCAGLLKMLAWEQHWSMFLVVLKWHSSHHISRSHSISSQDTRHCETGNNMTGWTNHIIRLPVLPFEANPRLLSRDCYSGQHPGLKTALTLSEAYRTHSANGIASRNGF